MKSLIQRVSSASVVIDKQTVARIDRGILLLLGVERGDDDLVVERMVPRILAYRIFPDENSKMNRSLKDIQGGLLVVPQFTLAADTRKGLRPSFSCAADPESGRRLFASFVGCARRHHSLVEEGVFGADMQVNLVNDGPVTFMLSSAAEL